MSLLPAASLVSSTTPAEVQAIRHDGLHLTGVNTFGPGQHEAAGVRVDGAASILFRRPPRGLTTVAVSDPTMDRHAVTVVLRGRALTPVSSDGEVRVSTVPAGTRLDVVTHEAYGRSLTVTLRG